MDFETIAFTESNGVGWVTLDRPERHNAFDERMQDELQSLWRSLRNEDDVRCIVLTARGDKAFCTGIDRSEIPDDGATEFDPYRWDDPGERLGPKSNGLFTPVIAAVNGMACGGAFYLLGEVEFIIAADHATFFDPHVTFGMAAVYEPTVMVAPACPSARSPASACSATTNGCRPPVRTRSGWCPRSSPATSSRTPPAGRRRPSPRSRHVPCAPRSKRCGPPASSVCARPWPARPPCCTSAPRPDALAEGQATFASGERIEPRIR